MALEHSHILSLEEYFALEHDEVILACLDVHFPLAVAYEDVLPTEEITAEDDEDDEDVWSDD